MSRYLHIFLALLLAPAAYGQGISAGAASNADGRVALAAEQAAPDSAARFDRDPEFELFLDRLDSAIHDFVNGDPAAFMATWSHSAGVTVAGGFGGAIVSGWETLGPRLARVSSTYSNTIFSTERISVRSAGDLAFVVQHERFHRPGAEAPYQEYRVTMIFHREDAAWRLVHRHADAQMTFQPRD